MKDTNTRSGSPALTPESRENQLISLAYDLVEERLRNGTASAQETVHFLKLGNTKAQLEKKKIEAETKLLEEKREAVESTKQNAEVYQQAIDAMRKYNGVSTDED